MPKGKPIPVRFEEMETAFLNALHEKTNLPVSDIIRRCVRLAAREMNVRGSPHFLMDLAEMPAITPRSYAHPAPSHLNEMPKQTRPFDPRPEPQPAPRGKTG